MNKKIFTIGYEVPGRSEDFLDFSSRKSLMDADILIFETDLPGDLDYPSTFQGKNSYTENSSFKFREYSQHWKNELVSFLKSGKTVFVFLSKKEEFFLKTGEKTFSGTGRNTRTTNIVNLHNNYEFLPTDIGRIITASGRHIEFTGNNLFTDFFKKFKDNLEYQVYLENIGSADSIFIGKDKTKILGAVYRVGAGCLVTLPYLNYDKDNFIEHKSNKKGEDSSYWTKKAVAFGNMLIGCLLEIDKGLSQDFSKTPPPNWVFDAKFAGEKEICFQEEMEKNNKKIKELEKNNQDLQLEFLKEQVLKDLLFEQGKSLENAVIEALKILGFSAENFDNGELELDQVIISPEGHRYIGECEGKDEKAIDITKFRQLLESLSADFAREDVEEKAFGILFGNSQRLNEPEKRTLDFTKKCKIGAEREKIALVRTIDLFEVAKYLKDRNNKEFQKKCRQAIYDGLGSIVKFPLISKK